MFIGPNKSSPVNNYVELIVKYNHRFIPEITFIDTPILLLHFCTKKMTLSNDQVCNLSQKGTK